jgi:hypothetical protein
VGRIGLLICLRGAYRLDPSQFCTWLIKFTVGQHSKPLSDLGRIGL